MSKRCLITGVGGSLGCHVLQHLLKNTNWDLVGIDSFRHKGLTDRLASWVVRLPRVRIFTHDLTAPVSRIMTKKIGPVDYIINLAAISDVDVSLDDPAYAIRTNVDVMVNMVEYALHTQGHAAQGRPVFLHISTDEIYGPVDGSTLHKEWDPVIPSNPYSASKACQESIGISSWRSYGLPLIIINCMNLFGEMQSGSKFPCMVQRAVRDGETVRVHKFGDEYGSRHYIHARNAADAMLFLLRRVSPYAHISGVVDRPDRFNVAGDQKVNNLELAQMIAEMLGKTLKYEDWEVKDIRPGHDRAYGLDGSKLAALGWKSPLSFEESLRRTVAWYSENNEWLDPK